MRTYCVALATRMLGGMTLGILGLGNIGGHMAHVGQALGMHVIAWGPTLTPERAQASGVEYVSFDDLFRRVDVLFVSVNCPRSPGVWWARPNWR